MTSEMIRNYANGLFIRLNTFRPILRLTSVAVPVFSCKVNQFNYVIMSTYGLTAMSLRRVVTRSNVTRVIRRRVRVDLCSNLGILTNIIRITRAIPIVTYIVVTTRLCTLLIYLFLNLTTIVINTSVNEFRLMNRSLMIFCQRIGPN